MVTICFVVSAKRAGFVFPFAQLRVGRFISSLTPVCHSSGLLRGRAPAVRLLRLLSRRPFLLCCQLCYSRLPVSLRVAFFRRLSRSSGTSFRFLLQVLHPFVGLPFFGCVFLRLRDFGFHAYSRSSFSFRRLHGVRQYRFSWWPVLRPSLDFRSFMSFPFLFIRLGLPFELSFRLPLSVFSFYLSFFSPRRFVNAFIKHLVFRAINGCS